MTHKKIVTKLILIHIYEKNFNVPIFKFQSSATWKLTQELFDVQQMEPKNLLQFIAYLNIHENM